MVEPSLAKLIDEHRDLGISRRGKTAFNKVVLPAPRNPVRNVTGKLESVAGTVLII